MLPLRVAMAQRMRQNHMAFPKRFCDLELRARRGAPLFVAAPTTTATPNASRIFAYDFPRVAMSGVLHVRSTGMLHVGDRGQRGGGPLSWTHERCPERAEHKGVLHMDDRGQRNERGMAQVRLDW